MANTAWGWRMEIRRSVRSHHQSRLKHIQRGQGCRKIQKSQQKPQLGNTAPEEITRGTSCLRVGFVSLIRHLARDVISQVPDFWRSSDPFNLGFLPTSRLAVLIRHCLSLPISTPQRNLAVATFIFLIKDKFIGNQSATEAQLSVKNTQHLS